MNPLSHIDIVSHSRVAHKAPMCTARGRSTRKESRAPQFVTDPDGTLIALVPTNKPGKVAEIEAEVWERLLANGLSPQLVWNTSLPGYSYVRGRWLGDKAKADPITLVSIAALVAGVSRSEQVKFKDGNRLNLRRSNLDIVPRQGRRREDPAALARPVYVPERDHAHEPRPQRHHEVGAGGAQA
jgi:hypothetical protein